MTTGEKIRILRKEKKLSQAKLGVLAGVSQDAISAYEFDRRAIDIPTLGKIAGALGVSVADLLPDAVNHCVEGYQARSSCMAYLIRCQKIPMTPNLRNMPRDQHQQLVSHPV